MTNKQFTLLAFIIVIWAIAIIAHMLTSNEKIAKRQNTIIAKEDSIINILTQDSCVKECVRCRQENTIYLHRL